MVENKKSVLHSIFEKLVFAMKNPKTQVNEKNRNDILMASEMHKGRYGQISYLVELMLVSVVLFLVAMVAIAFPIWLKVPIGIGIMAIMFYTFTLRSYILNKRDNTAIVKRRLFGLLTVTRRVEPLSTFYGVRIRTIPKQRVAQLLVELVGLQGSTLTLMVYESLSNPTSALEDALAQRNSIAEWANIKVMLDPSYPANN